VILVTSVSNIVSSIRQLFGSGDVADIIRQQCLIEIGRLGRNGPQLGFDVGFDDDD